MTLCEHSLRVRMKDKHRQELCHGRAWRLCGSRVGSGGLELCVRAFGLVLVTLLICTSPVSGAREPSKGYDADLTLFSPEGRLYQVEYVMRAVGQYGPPTVGVHGDDCCVVACRRELPDDLVYPESVSSIFRITDDIYGACTGMPGDIRYQVKRARLQALEYKRQYGSPMPSRLLALAMADVAQVNTQHAAMRPMACVSLFISVDDPAGPLLFRVEPSGQYFPAWGTAAGRGSAPSVEYLERALEEARDQQALTVEGGVGEEEAPATQGVESAEDHVDEAGGEGDDGVEAGDGGDVGANGRGGDGAEVSPGSGGSKDDGGGAGVEGFIHGNNRRGLEERLRRRESGFGVAGEDETVLLALKALSKASFGKEQERPLTDANVEIAIASAKTGVRVCSRTEVKGFLGKLACARQ